MMDETLRKTLLNSRQIMKNMIQIGVPGPDFTKKNWDDTVAFAKEQIAAISAELCQDPFHRDHMELGSKIFPVPDFAKKKAGES